MLNKRVRQCFILFFVCSIITLFISFRWIQTSIRNRFVEQSRQNYPLTIEMMMKEDSTIFNDDPSIWKINFNSFIRFQIEIDLTTQLNNDIRDDHRRSDRISGIKYETGMNETLYFFLSSIRSNVKSDEEICSIYLQMLKSNFHSISSDIVLNNGQSISIPRIVPLNESLKMKTCPKLVESHFIWRKDHRLTFTLTTIDENAHRRISLYDYSRNVSPIDLVLSNEIFSEKSFHWIPLIDDHQLYLIHSLSPLIVVRCSHSPTEYSCQRFLNDPLKNNRTQIFSPSTTFIPYDDENEYFIGFVHSQINYKSCEQFLRPHLILFSSPKKQFELLYLSDVLQLEDLPYFHRSFFPKKGNQSDQCLGLIRSIQFQSILQWNPNEDQLLTIVSIDQTKSYLIQIFGLKTIIDRILHQRRKSSISKDLRRTMFNGWMDSMEMKTSNYLRDRFETNEKNWKRIEEEENQMLSDVLKDRIVSPTIPSFDLMTNAPAIDVNNWISADYVNFGLMGRYFKSLQSKSSPHSYLMIDAGGNHGTYGFYAAKFHQNVFIFEVLPKYWIVLRESIHLNDPFDQFIRLFPYGVSDENGQWTVLPDDGTTRLDYSPLKENSSPSMTFLNNSIEICAYSLQEFIFQQVSLLKIDVEGFEIRALKGAKRVMKRFPIGAILIEIAPHRWIWNNITLDQGIHLLQSLTIIGSYHNYLIGRDDLSCPQRNFTKIGGLIQRNNLTMINMNNGNIEMAPYIYQVLHWNEIIHQMNQSSWSCNFWMENLSFSLH